MKKTIPILVGLILLGGTVYWVIPSGEDAAQQLDRAQTGEAKEAAQIQASAEHQELVLSEENTKVGFSCAKDLAGKTLAMRGGWSSPFGSRMSGRAMLNPQSGQLLQIELTFEINTLWSEHDQLTDALLTKGFFQAKEYPQATFISTRIATESPEGRAQTDATHQIEGNFTLNGITKSIFFPARIELSADQFQLHSQFSLQREDFNIRFADTAGFGLLTDENISKLVALDVLIDGPIVTAATEQTGHVVADSDGPGKLSADGPSIDGPSIDRQPVDWANLPPTYTETIPATQIEFSMVLIPGDAEHGISPLYVERHEVTWNEFMPWVAGRDLENQQNLGELRAMKLRPSPPYGSVDRGFGMDRRPALGMSQLSANLYCQWLSKQTGKTYRLPTEQEWEHIYQLGGGRLDGPPTEEDANRLTVYSDNSWDDDVDDWATRPVESTQANQQGIYDLAGNVCEWVTGTNDQRVARGGHFDSEAKDLGMGRHVETAAWNRDYPNEPKSIWWFVNAPWVGFRVVCEASEVDVGKVEASSPKQEEAAPAA
jgi:polyisoprenoid-binding protein YceI